MKQRGDRMSPGNNNNRVIKFMEVLPMAKIDPNIPITAGDGNMTSDIDDIKDIVKN
ncbi:MAG: hypothetical protein ACYSWS_01195 [Planctomycetota bacterium]|jgi:hypothetical protein